MSSSSRKRALSPPSSLSADQRRRLIDVDEVNLQNEKLTDENRTLVEELERNKERAARQLGKPKPRTCAIAEIAPCTSISEERGYYGAIFAVRCAATSAGCPV